MKVVLQSAMQSTYGVGVLLSVIGIAFFSTKSIFIKIAYTYGVDPVSLMFLRMLMAAPIYLAIYYYNRSSMQVMSNKDLIFTLVTGVVGYYIASILDLQGLLYISASLERMILYLFPSFVLVISVVFLKHRLKITEVLAFTVSYAGILFVYLQDFSVGGSDITLGAGLVLASAVAFAIFVVTSGYLIAKVGAVQFTTVSMMGASVAIAVHFSISGQSTIIGFQSDVYFYAFLLATLCTVLPSFLVNMGIKRIGATKAAILSTFSPIITVVLAQIALNEHFSQNHFFGFILVMVGMSMISLQKKT